MKKRKPSPQHVRSIINDSELPSIGEPLVPVSTVPKNKVASRPYKMHSPLPSVSPSRKKKTRKRLSNAVTASAREKRVKRAAGPAFSFTRADSRHANCRTKAKTFSALMDSRTIKGSGGRRKPKRRLNRSRRQYC